MSDQDEKRRREERVIPPYPNPIWDVISKIPLGMYVLTRAYAHFNGSNYLTIPKAQTIGSEYKTFYCGTIKPTTPDGTEVIYFINTPEGDANLFITDIDIRWSGNGLPNHVVTTFNPMKENLIEVLFKDGALKVCLNSVEYEKLGVSWVNSTWPSFSLGSRNPLEFGYTGQMWNVSDATEQWPLNGNLKGSLGNDAVLTGSTEAELFDNEAYPTSYVGEFNGSNYLTIPKAQTIGVDWKVFFEETITPLSPINTESLYTMNSENGLYLSANGNSLNYNGNGSGNFGVGSYASGVEMKIRLEKKIGFIRVFINDIETAEVAITWTTLTWPSFYVGANSLGGRLLTATTHSLSADGDDGLENWTLNNTLKGSKGNDAILTGSTEKEFFKGVNYTGTKVKKSRYVARFNGSNYLTINKTQSIGVEYGVFYESPIIPTAPQGTELVYSPILPSGLFFFFLDGTEVFCNGNGIPATSVGTYNQGVKNYLKLELKLGMIRATVNGVQTEIPITFIETSWASFRVGASHLGSFDLTGQIWDLKADGDDGLESWPLNNTLTGSLGNDAVLTGSTESVLFGDSLLVPV